MSLSSGTPLFIHTFIEVSGLSQILLGLWHLSAWLPQNCLTCSLAFVLVPCPPGTRPGWLKSSHLVLPKVVAERIDCSRNDNEFCASRQRMNACSWAPQWFILLEEIQLNIMWTLYEYRCKGCWMDEGECGNKLSIQKYNALTLLVAKLCWIMSRMSREYF